MTFVFFTNTPTPSTIALLEALNKRIEAFGYFQESIDFKQNVSWHLNLPEYFAQKGSIFNILQELRHKKPDFILLGGYRLKWHIFLILWAKINRIPLYLWMEAPEPKNRFKNTLLNAVQYGIFMTIYGLFWVDQRSKNAYQMVTKCSKMTTNGYHWLPYPLKGDAFIRERPVLLREIPPVRRFLFVGQLIERKGVNELLEVFAKISPRVATLTLAGLGPLADTVKAFCDHTGHTYAGFVEPDDLPKLMAEHDVFVFPSRYDGWGLVVMEAMAAGLPVISTPHVGAFADLISPEQNGLTCGMACQAHDVASLKHAVDYYIKHPQACIEHGQNARTTWQASRANVEHAAAFLIKVMTENCAWNEAPKERTF